MTNAMNRRAFLATSALTLSHRPSAQAAGAATVLSRRRASQDSLRQRFARYNQLILTEASHD